MPGDLLNTKELAAYLGIHEKQVYALVKAERIPATRITGKWVFPRRLIDEWLETDARQGLAQTRGKDKKMANALLAAGSNDPVLDILQGHFHDLCPDQFVFSASIGSTEGLRALNLGYTDIAWSHLLDPLSGEYNIPYFPTLLPRIRPVVVNLFRRDLDFVTAPGNPFTIRGFEDLARKEIRFINRQKGSGTRLLLDHHLAGLGIAPNLVHGYDREASTHHEVGRAIIAGEADTGVATRAIADLLGLTFVHITQERFDMVLDQPTYFDRGFQNLLETLTSRQFRQRVTGIGSYDFGLSGKIIHSPAK